MKGKYPIEVRLIAGTAVLPGLLGGHPNASHMDHPSEELAEYAGRLCTDTIGKLGTNPKFLRARIDEGHESILEHVSLTFYIKASRVFTHELVRHRIASYSQRSQRYVKEGEPKFITPPKFQFTDGTEGGVLDDWQRQDRHANRFLNHMQACWDLYAYYLAEGIKPEIARYVLPNACETQIVMTMNLRELRHFIKERTSKRALPEMQQVAREVLRHCLRVAPAVFEDLEGRLVDD